MKGCSCKKNNKKKQLSNFGQIIIITTRPTCSCPPYEQHRHRRHPDYVHTDNQASSCWARTVSTVGLQVDVLGVRYTYFHSFLLFLGWGTGETAAVVKAMRLWFTNTWFDLFLARSNFAVYYIVLYYNRAVWVLSLIHI